MKTQNLLLTVLLSITFFNCNTEELSNEEINKNPNFRVVEQISNDSSNRLSLDDPCMTVNLIAGQHYDAGTVTIDASENDLIITYRTANGWGITDTHMSIGGCDLQSFPTNGQGSPKVGRFEHGTTHNGLVNEVTYYISKDAVDDVYCFAAHALVEKDGMPDASAWAEGFDFGGNSWAMYVEADKTDCDVIPTGPQK